MRPLKRRRDAGSDRGRTVHRDSGFGLSSTAARRRPLIGYALVNVVDDPALLLLQIFGTVKWPVSHSSRAAAPQAGRFAAGKCNFRMAEHQL